MVFSGIYFHDHGSRNNRRNFEQHKESEGLIMFLFLSAVAAKIAIESILSGAVAGITVLTGLKATKSRRRR